MILKNILTNFFKKDFSSLATINFFFRIGIILFTSLASRTLEFENYSDFRKLYILIEISLPLISFSLSKSLFNFIDKNFNTNHLCALFLLKFIGVIFFLLVFFLLSLFRFDFIPTSISFFLIISAVSSQVFVNTSISISLFKSSLNKSITIVFLWFVILLLALVYFYWDNFISLENFIFLRSLLNIVLVFGILFYSKIKIISFNKKRVLHNVRYYFKKSWDVALSYFISGFFIFGDKLVAAELLSKKEYSMFVNGALEVPFISILTGSLSLLMLNEISKSFKIGDSEGAIKIIKQTSIKSLKILAPVFALCFVFSSEIVVILFGENYEESSAIFQTYLLLLPARVIFFSQIFVAYNQSKIIIPRGIIENSLLIILSYFLFNLGGIFLGMYSIIIITYFFIIPYNLYFLSKIMRISWYRILPFKSIMLTFGLFFVITKANILFFENFNILFKIPICLFSIFLAYVLSIKLFSLK